MNLKRKQIIKDIIGKILDNNNIEIRFNNKEIEIICNTICYSNFHYLHDILKYKENIEIIGIIHENHSLCIIGEIK